MIPITVFVKQLVDGVEVFVNVHVDGFRLACFQNRTHLLNHAIGMLEKHFIHVLNGMIMLGIISCRAFQ